jgi:hypothetical protein
MIKNQKSLEDGSLQLINHLIKEGMVEEVIYQLV